MKPILTTSLLGLALFLGVATPAIAQDRPQSASTAIDFVFGWEKLGETRVDGGRRRVDHDTIYIGRHEGRFSRLMIKVSGNDIVLNDMTVTFANGETFSPDIRSRMDEGGRSRVIDLPGRRRAIQKVDFSYRNASSGRATVELYAR